MKKHFTFILCIGILLFLFGCRSADESRNKRTIAFVMKTLNNPFFIDMKKGAEEAAKNLGVDIIIQAAEREVDVEKQMQIIENLIQRKVAAICITPSGSKEIIPAILKANKAEIPVIIVDTRIDEKLLKESDGKFATFIGSDNIDGGRIAAKYIVEKLNGNGYVAILEGIPGHETGDARLQGFREVISGYKGIKIVATQTANWERDQGFNVFQNILQANPKVQAVFACNDIMALGAIEAISASQKKNKIIVVGFDAINDSREAILSGLMDASIAQHPEEMGKLSVEYAYKVITGESIPTDISVRIDLITKEYLQRAGK